MKNFTSCYTPEELLEVEDAIEEFFFLCPGLDAADKPFSDRDILLGEVKAEEVAKWWIDDSVLFDKGYFPGSDDDLEAHISLDDYETANDFFIAWRKELARRELMSG